MAAIALHIYTYTCNCTYLSTFAQQQMCAQLSQCHPNAPLHSVVSTPCCHLTHGSNISSPISLSSPSCLHPCLALDARKHLYTFFSMVSVEFYFNFNEEMPQVLDSEKLWHTLNKAFSNSTSQPAKRLVL